MATSLFRLIPLALCVPWLLLVGCPDDSSVGTLGGPKKTTPSNISGSTTTGNAATSSFGLPIVRSIQVTPATLSLNAPAADGTAPAGLATTQALSAQVFLSNSQPDPKGVVWSVSDPAHLTVDASGTVSVKPGAVSGSVSVIATSVTDPTQQGRATVTLTNDGILRLAILPLENPGTAMTTNANVTLHTGGGFVAAQDVTGTTGADFRIPANLLYDVEITRATDSQMFMDGMWMYMPSDKRLFNLKPGPNQILTATATMDW